MRVAISTLVLLALFGCVTTADQGRRMQAQIEGLQVALDQQRRENREQQVALDQSLEAGLVRIDGKLAEVSRAMGALGLSARKNDADFGATLDGMLAEIQKLRGEVEELKHRADQLEEGLSETRTEVDARIQSSKAEATAQIEAIKGDTAVARLQDRKKAERLAEGGERKKLLDMAEGRLKEGDYELARAIARDYLKRWPRDPQAGGAQLLLAETYFRAKKFRPAILEYNRFREGYPKHPLMPGALFNIGESFVALGLKREAGQFYDAVISRYKKTDTAGRARKRKKELKIR